MISPVNTSKTVIVGLGLTGVSCARFLSKQGQAFSVMDSRENPPGEELIKREMPAVELLLGRLDEEVLENADRLILSPGIGVGETSIQKAKLAGAKILGDIELFAQSVNTPIVAITGSNGKSTVTTLLGAMVEAAGLSVKVGGNLGVPALDLLDDARPDYYVLELSSFQLETTNSLNAVAAVVLNLSEDHMDRYESLGDYAQAKQVVYKGDGVLVVNLDDAQVVKMAEEMNSGAKRKVIPFTLGRPAVNGYGILDNKGACLARGDVCLLSVNELCMKGRHNWANALAALALGEVLKLPMDVMLSVLRDFPGLAHRTQWVRDLDGVTYINDSKGTNVGATVSAIQGLIGQKVLIAGGLGKDADFLPLRDAVQNYDVKAVVLIGKDAHLLQKALAEVVPVYFAGDMVEAVRTARTYAQSGDTVLLSPACASFDMYRGFEHRGEEFVSAVEALK